MEEIYGPDPVQPAVRRLWTQATARSVRDRWRGGWTRREIAIAYGLPVDTVGLIVAGVKR